MSGTGVVKVLYKPVGLIVSVLGGMLAGMIFKRLWKLAAGDQQVPVATDGGQSWGAVLLAAAAEGAVFGFVKAAVDRGAATGVRRLTGVWPGDSQHADEEPGAEAARLPAGRVPRGDVVRDRAGRGQKPVSVGGCRRRIPP